MRTVSIPEARKYCKERGWKFYWVRSYRDDGKLYRYIVTAWKAPSNQDIRICHPSRQYAIQAVYQAVKLFEETTLKAPSPYIKQAKTRPTRRAKNITHP